MEKEYLVLLWGVFFVPLARRCKNVLRDIVCSDYRHVFEQLTWMELQVEDMEDEPQHLFIALDETQKTSR